MHRQSSGFRKDIKRLEQNVKTKETYLNQLTDIIMKIKHYYNSVCQKLGVRDKYKIVISENGEVIWTHNISALPRAAQASQVKHTSQTDVLDFNYPDTLLEKIGLVSEMHNTKENQRLLAFKYKQEVDELAKVKSATASKRDYLRKLTENNEQLRNKLQGIESVLLIATGRVQAAHSAIAVFK